MAEQPSNVNYLTTIRPVLPYFRDSGGTAEQTTGPIGNIYPNNNCQHLSLVRDWKEKTLTNYVLLQELLRD